MTATYTIHCVSRAVSPITHMAGSKGNESIVAREPVSTPKGVLWVPYLSGNAIRHRLVREPGVRWLISQYDLTGKLSLAQLNFLFHGGALTQGGGREDTAKIAMYQRLFPLLRLMGGALPDQILSGSLQASRGTLVCEENRRDLSSLLPCGWDLPDRRLKSAESFVSGYQYTRGDAARTARDMLPSEIPPEDEERSNLMIMAGQSVNRGATFIHQFKLSHVSELEVGALLWSLSLWQHSGGTIGGQAAKGHGRLETKVSIAGTEQNVADMIGAYQQYAIGVKEEAVNWLNQAFGCGEWFGEGEKPKRGKAKAKAS